jgi:arsenate reductase (thioredoxin)
MEPQMKTKLLFLCTGNSCRSQMAEGFLRAYGGDLYEAHSAGTKPSSVNPLAVAVMRETGIDISGQRSKHVGEYLGQHFPFVITVCNNVREQCPLFPGPCIREHWPFEDPAKATGTREEELQLFRKVRDEIGAKVRSFVTQKAPA